jgi:hypothetical protein
MKKKEDDSNAKHQDKTGSSEEKNRTSKAAESLGLPNDEPVGTLTKSKGATPPPHGQLEYWEQDLFLKKRSFHLSLVGFIAIFISILFNTYQAYISREQFKLNAEQVRRNTEQSTRLAKSICHSIQNETLAHVTDLDKVFLQRTYLRPYFYEDKSIGHKDKYYDEASATAELVLDIFDMIAEQSVKYKDCWDDSETWDKWIMDTFSTSPILRETMEERRDWYAEHLLLLYDKALERNRK